MFAGMAPAQCAKLIGHYRGEHYPCLKKYAVTVRDDPRVGVKPAAVLARMVQFEQNLASALKIFDSSFGQNLSPQHSALRLAKFVDLICLFLVEFLTVHPYANGNGHTARLLVWILLGRYGFWPKHWTLDASPNYHQAIASYRSGNKTDLRDFMLACI
ncbi:MAG: Fic family protein [Rhodocyclaceae bacterium]|nr:Fic family protein [Rhodocyclaceae bacterium]MCA3051230.1 Fic family protein [Rhodocyclaceae bacterium]MCA3057841.1 Fic family protein [Rhodocyclaceae bacterium]MCA3064776.1 Fic family protein [Rhodocyclaceae bacterium]MCA3066034.1 Fic family protein [Rhodocyclaceae bacterium]